MINTQQVEVPLSRTLFHDPKIVRAIEVRLNFEIKKKSKWIHLVG